ncbi:MAG: nucleotide sugar dehydrogenase [Rhodospirillales bacterium]|jgi:UDP-N-acetyl-D-glucosamine dehydrogenase|nr:nucleotide sugar dehydrogenase [Rhodospirillales bacterium]
MREIGAFGAHAVTAGALDVPRLEQRFRDRTALVGIIGLGYVGLPLMLAAAKAGFRTLGFDINAQRVEELNGGASPLQHIPDAQIAAVIGDGRFTATADFARLAEPDALLICVPTPLTKQREPDLSFVETTARDIAASLRPGQLIVLESTTWPGTTREVVKPILEATGLRSGRDLFLAFSPEREDPGNPDFETSRIPKVIGGEGEAALRLALALYEGLVCRVVPVSSLEVAEAVKLTENIFRAVNIALVNELKVVYHAMGIDIFEVIEAAKTKPFGYMPFYPGPGLGGHCIPIDPFYLTWKAREFGIATRFIELAGEINTTMPRYVVERTAEALDAQRGRGLNGAEVLIIGLAYKKNINDTRESPAFAVMELLERRGARVSYHDPLVPEILPTRQHGGLAGRRSVPLDAASLGGFDAVVIVTDHDDIDWAALRSAARLIVDTRGRYPEDPGVIRA